MVRTGMRWIAVVLLLGISHTSVAEPRRSNGLASCPAVDGHPTCSELEEAKRPQLQADLGLAVVGVAYEQPLTEHVSLQIEAQIFGTYFLPWVSAGTNAAGFGGQLRPTWFARWDRRGFYVAPYVRIDRVSDDTSKATGFCAGGFAGWAFGLTRKLDLRIGGGAQYMRYKSGTIDIATPFLALDSSSAIDSEVALQDPRSKP